MQHKQWHSNHLFPKQLRDYRVKGKCGEEPGYKGTQERREYRNPNGQSRCPALVSLPKRLLLWFSLSISC